MKQELKPEFIKELLANYGKDAKFTFKCLLREMNPCSLMIDDDIIESLQDGRVVGGGNGEEFNTNLWSVLCGMEARGSCLDVGPGNLSPYPSFLIAMGYKEVDVYDIREPVDWDFEINPVFGELKDIKKKWDIVTCLSVIEHAGLGRYGEDDLDADGDIKLANELKKLVKKGGYFIFAVPLGRGEVVFNWHRIYDDVRLGKLTDGLEVVAEIGKRMTDDVTRQPIIVCKK